MDDVTLISEMDSYRSSDKSLCLARQLGGALALSPDFLRMRAEDPTRFCQSFIADALKKKRGKQTSLVVSARWYPQ